LRFAQTTTGNELNQHGINIIYHERILIFVCNIHYTGYTCPEIETTTACEALQVSSGPTISDAPTLN